MPVSTESKVAKPQSLAQHSAQAKTRLLELIGRRDTKLLEAAVLEAAVYEAESNPNFLGAVQYRYDVLASTTKVATRRSTSGKPLKELVPIIPAGELVYDRDEKPSAYKLQRLYGNAQLRDALDGLTLVTLKEMAQEVMARNPGTKPESQRTKAGVIEYIVARLTGGR